MSKRWSDYIDAGGAPKYSESFKRKVVAEVESGLLNKDEARRKYHIGGKTTVLRWCRKYGKLSGGKNKQEKPIVDDKELLKELEFLRRQNRELRKKLDDAELKAFALEKLIEVAERKLGVKIKKKTGAMR